jgi:predicted ribosomally synthesized peptide with nif11-like leader
MAKAQVEAFLIKGGEEKKFRMKYNSVDDKEEFVTMAKEDGFDFSVEDLDLVLKESGDSFESFGNPRKKDIWWF